VLFNKSFFDKTVCMTWLFFCFLFFAQGDILPDKSEAQKERERVAEEVRLAKLAEWNHQQFVKEQMLRRPWTEPCLPLSVKIESYEHNGKINTYLTHQDADLFSLNEVSTHLFQQLNLKSSIVRTKGQLVLRFRGNVADTLHKYYAK